MNFIRTELGGSIPSPRLLQAFGEGYVKEVEEYAQKQGLSILQFKKEDDKDAIARQRLAECGEKPGVILIGKAQEKATAYRSTTEHKEKRVWFTYSRVSVCVNHYYFYIYDQDFGLFFIKVCTYCPFEVKMCLNGHEWAKQQARQAGIEFCELSNGFASCSEAGRLQAICDQLSGERIQTLFDQWIEQLPWPLTPKQRAAGYRHQLSLWQLEVSRTQVFRDPEQGRLLFETIIRENLDLGRPDRVQLLFNRKIIKSTPGEFYTRVLQDGVLPSIRIRYKHSTLKQYFKDGRALRTEMVFNNPADFGFKRSLLASFAQLVVLGRSCNRRLLEQEQITQDCFTPLDSVRQITQSTVGEDGQRASALRFADPRVMALFAALTRFTFAFSPITNKSLRQPVAILLGCDPEQYSAQQMSYDLRRLRLKGLLVRTPKTQTYSLTSLGLRVATFFTKLYDRLFNPGLAALLPTLSFPSDLAQALDSLDSVLQLSIHEAALL